MWPTVQQKSGRCGEVAVSEGLTEYRSFTVRCLQTFYKHLKVDYHHNYLVKRLCICLFFFFLRLVCCVLVSLLTLT